MKSELEEKDIEAIAQRVIELLKPLISVNTLPGEDVPDKPGLAKYLKVSPGTVNKLVSDRAIPFYKLSEGKQSGVRFRKKRD